MHRRRILITAALVLAFGGALAQTTAGSDGTSLEQDAAGIDQAARSAGTTQVAGRIAGDFTAFAGSPDNAAALVSGLRNGSAIELSSTDAQGKVTTVTVPATTKPLGYGNVTITLALAQTSLDKVGITQPTAAQLQAALTGGTVTLAEFYMYLEHVVGRFGQTDERLMLPLREHPDFSFLGADPPAVAND